MAEIQWGLLNPVDIGSQVQQGFATGAAIVKQAQAKNALKAYLDNPADQKAYSALAYYDPQTAASIQTQQDRRQKLLLDQQTRQREITVGGMAAGGDVEGARRTALKAGDFDLVQHLDTLDKPARDRLGAFYKAAGPLAYQMRQMKEPAQRQQFLAQNRGILEATGVDPKVIDSFDVTNDQGLDGLIAANRTVDSLINDGKITWHQQGEQPSFATNAMGVPVGSQNPYAGTGAATAAPTGAPQQAVAGVLSSAGLPPHVVAGFLGNFHAEGGYGGAKGDGGSASGIAQWRGERAANFQQVIGKPVEQATPEEQAHFVVWEMQHPESAGMATSERDAILKAPTAEAAAALIDQHYERSSGQHLTSRIGAAKQIAVSMGAATHAATKAEYDALPSGAVFVAPDGSRRVKP
jgi:hypothetical protein